VGLDVVDVGLDVVDEVGLVVVDEVPEHDAAFRLQVDMGPKPTLFFALSKTTCCVDMTVSPRMLLPFWNRATNAV